MRSNGVPADAASGPQPRPRAALVDRFDGLRAVWPVALVGLAIVGYTFAVSVLLSRGTYGSGEGVGGVDAWVYYTAAGNAWTGNPLYGLAYPYFGSFAYPPPFAQFISPLSLVPFPVFLWLWRAIEMVCLRVAVGSWRNAGLALLLWPPVIAELDAANVHLVMAAAIARSTCSDARWLGPAALVKFTPVLAAPVGWLRDRRRLLFGAAAALAVLALSYALSPAAWSDYVAFLGSASQPTAGQVLGGIALAIRLPLAIVVSVVALRWFRLAAVAATLAYPIMWVTSLSTLVAVAAPIPKRDRR